MKQSTRVRAVSIALVITLAALLAGCPQGTQQKTAVAMRDFAYSTQALQTGEIQFHKLGKIPDATHQRVQKGLLILADLGPKVDAAVAANDTAGLLVGIDAALAATNDMLLGVADIDDPNTRLEIQTLVLAVRTILANGKVLIQK